MVVYLQIFKKHLSKKLTKKAKHDKLKCQKLSNYLSLVNISYSNLSCVNS